jgi:predicted peroxiredoxin
MAPLSSRRPLVVLLTVGQDAAERCSAGLTIAATAASAGATVSLWLSGDAVWLALPGRAAAFDLPHTAPLDGVLDLLLGAGTVTVAELSARRRGVAEGDLIDGIRIAGAAAYVEEVGAPDVQALVF